jgi:heme exporter protein C
VKFTRSRIFHFVVGIALAVVTFISFSTPMAGSFEDVVNFKMNSGLSKVPVKCTVVRPSFDSIGKKFFGSRDFTGRVMPVSIAGVLPSGEGSTFVADISYDARYAEYHLEKVVRLDPGMTFPLIPGLGELGRNMLFHVPMSMVAFLAFLMGTINSILYLAKKKSTPEQKMLLDQKARAASAVGLLFTLLSTVTGSIWAKFSWGTFWNWDPREVDIFILLLIYAAYFILRSLLEESEEKKARIAAVYNIIAFASVPLLMFVLPRIAQSLHPGGGGAEAPVINANGKTHTDPTLLGMLWTNVFVFVLLYFWLADLTRRVLGLAEHEEEDI